MMQGVKIEKKSHEGIERERGVPMTPEEKARVKIDKQLHKEVKNRYAQLDVAPYGGFLNPDFIIEKDGETIKDIKLSYPTDYIKQMLQYDQIKKLKVKS